MALLIQSIVLHSSTLTKILAKIILCDLKTFCLSASCLLQYVCSKIGVTLALFMAVLLLRRWVQGITNRAATEYATAIISSNFTLNMVQWRREYMPAPTLSYLLNPRD
jgi:hypothetical protein